MSTFLNSTITISSEGCVTATGSGTILLQTNSAASEAGPFIQQIISRSKLNRWNLLSSNSKSNIIALSSPGALYPREAAIIPLWSCQGIELPLIFTNPFAGKVKSDAIAMAIFSSSKPLTHVFDNETSNELYLEMAAAKQDLQKLGSGNFNATQQSSDALNFRSFGYFAYTSSFPASPHHF
jgi:hypothetical protein